MYKTALAKALHRELCGATAARVPWFGVRAASIARWGIVFDAVAEGYAKGKAGPPTPYRGYLFHILTRQGKDAPGGAKSYIVNGKMTEGFAFVAYPAEYRSSGVMTFIVNQDGVVYQKDLGKKTEALGKAMPEYNPIPVLVRGKRSPRKPPARTNPTNF